MKLTKEQILSALFGADHVDEDGDILRPRKCTAKQTEAWFSKSQTLGYRALTTTGIRLDFSTDAKSVTVAIDRTENDSYAVPSAATFKLDILVDGLLFRHFTAEEFDTGAGVLSFDLPEGEHRVTVVLPSHKIAGIGGATLSDGASFKPYIGYRRRFLFIGDSITQGWMSVYDSISFAYRTAAHYDADLINQGVGGSTFFAKSFDRPHFEPDAVFIALGTNDYTNYASLDDMKKEMDAQLAAIAAAYPGAKLIGISPIMRLDADDPVRKIGRFDEVTAAVKASLAAHGFFVVDGCTLVPHDPAFLADKFLHPNDLGFAIYAENLIRAIDPILA